MELAILAGHTRAVRSSTTCELDISGASSLCCPDHTPHKEDKDMSKFALTLRDLFQVEMAQTHLQLVSGGVPVPAVHLPALPFLGPGIIYQE